VPVIEPLLKTLEDNIAEKTRNLNIAKVHARCHVTTAHVCLPFAIYGSQVLMDGMHDIERAAHVTENVLVATYSAMMQQVLFSRT
jgi:hypothetical protein